jgi:Lon protease-like protein
MSAQLLPIFPLSLVLLPGMALPLHIFEERYKELMAEIIPGRGEFGIVLAKDEGIANVGCTAIVQNVFRRYDDGRLDLVASGQRRFLIGALDQSRSYLQAEVDYFDDDESPEAKADLRRRVLSAFAPLMRSEPGETADVSASASPLSFRLAERIEDVDKRQTVLSMRSETERLEYLMKVVPEYLIRQERTELAKRVAPLNGHAKHITTS